MMPRVFIATPGALALVLLLADYTPALAQLTDPFDHLHVAVSDVERARDWYIQHMGGNEGETPETVAWGKWPCGPSAAHSVALSPLSRRASERRQHHRP
jgi:hypothetical protein